MGNYGLLGRLGLQDNMSPTMKSVLGLTRSVNREVQDLNRNLQALGRQRTVIKVAIGGTAMQDLARLEQRLARVGRGSLSAGNNRPRSQAAAALLDPAPERSVARTARVVQMEEARQRKAAEQTAKVQQREAERLAVAQQRAEQTAARQRERERIKFEREATAFLAKRQQAEIAAARHVAQHTQVMSMPTIATYQRTANPVMRWLQTRMAQSDVTAARGALEQAAKSAPRFVEMARAGQAPAHLHGDAMKARWKQIQGLAQQEKAAMDRFKAASQGALVSRLDVSKLFSTLLPGPDKLKALEQGFSRTMSGMWSTAKSVFSGIGSVITAPFKLLTSLPGMLGIGGLAYGASSLIGGGLSFSAEMEQAQKAFKTMLGSESKAKAFVQQQFDFAAKTPFEFEDTMQNSRRLLAYGFKTEGAPAWRSVMPWMNSIGNAVSALGSGQQGFERLGLAIGQVQAKGRLMGEEIRQLTETGIPVVEILAKKLGMTQAEIMKGADAGILAEQALRALYEGLNEKYGGGMLEQSRTWKGLMTTGRDYIKTLLGAAGDGIRGKLQPLLAGVTDWFEQNPETVNRWRSKMQAYAYVATHSLVQYFEGAMKRVNGLMSDPRFQSADLFGKAGMMWDAIIGQPFEAWWNGPGKAKITSVAGSMGSFLGQTITGAVRAAVGLDASDGSMMGAGMTAGQAFVHGFIDAINEVDWGQVWGTAFKKHPVATTGATAWLLNGATFGLLGAGAGSLAKWGAGALWRMLFPAAATAGTAGSATAATAAGASQTTSLLARLGGPYGWIAAALLHKGIEGVSYQGHFNKGLAPELSARYGAKPTNIAKWLGMTADLIPWVPDKAADWYAKQNLNIWSKWGLIDDRNAGHAPAMAPDEYPLMPVTQRKEVSIKVDVAITRAELEDDDSLAKKIGNLFAIQLREQFENS